MEKKTYKHPKSKCVELDQTAIISTSNETLEYGGNIFTTTSSSAKSRYSEDKDYLDL